MTNRIARSASPVDMFSSPVLRGDRGRFELSILNAHEAAKATLAARGVPRVVSVEGVEYRPSPFAGLGGPDANLGSLVPISCEVEPAFFIASLSDPFAVHVVDENTMLLRVVQRYLYTLRW